MLLIRVKNTYNGIFDRNVVINKGSKKIIPSEKLWQVIKRGSLCDRMDKAMVLEKSY